MDQIKDAFKKVKRDIDALYFELDSIKISIKEVNWRISMLSQDVKHLSETKVNFNKKNSPTTLKTLSTDTPHCQTVKTQNTTDKQAFKPLNSQNLMISTGNRGVPTDRQTNRQTDQQTQKEPFLEKKEDQNPIQNAAQILDSLDSLKKEIRLKFKRLTEREIIVFSTLYQLDEEQGFADYKTIANKLSLTESSIRDYIGRLINKGIPVDKKKINNKSVQLSISPNLKRVASLSTIMQLISL